MGFTSFFAGIDKALHTFCAWFEKFLIKVHNDAPAIEHIVDGTIAYVGPALQLVLADVDPEAAKVVGPAFAEIQRDLGVASGLVYDFGANPHAADLIAGVENRLTDLLAAGHIKDPKLVQKVTAITNGVGALALAIAKAAAAASANKVS